MKKVISSVICLFLLVALCACGNDKTVTENDNEEKEVNIDNLSEENAYEIYSGVYLIGVSSFSGALPSENPEGERAENIICASVKNTTEKSYQIFDFSLTIDGVQYSFKARTLLAGRKMMLFDEEKKPMPDFSGAFECVLTDIAAFESEPSILSDKVKMSYSDSIINVENISDEELKNVFVYYKYISGDYLLGGITYRLSAGEIAPGEIIQLLARYYKPGSSEVVFVTYES